MTKEVKIMISIAAVLLLGGGALLLIEPEPVKPGDLVDNSLLIRSHSRMTGSLDAKVTIVEFGDMQCPACASAHPIIKRVLAEYQGNPDVNFVFRHFPLPTHRHAQIAAEALEAAGDQGKFWEMHDMMFSRQSVWSEASNALDIFTDYARELGLDTGRFRQAVESRQFAQVVQTDFSDGDQLGVHSTPTFFINGQMYRGVLDFAEFKQIIDERLAESNNENVQGSGDTQSEQGGGQTDESSNDSQQGEAGS